MQASAVPFTDSPSHDDQLHKINVNHSSEGAQRLSKNLQENRINADGQDLSSEGFLLTNKRTESQGVMSTGEDTSRKVFAVSKISNLYFS